MPTRPPTHRAFPTAAPRDRSYNATHRLAHGPDPRSTQRWRRVRAHVLAHQPLCADPFGLHLGHLVPATQVDHKLGIWQRPDLVYEEANLQGLCTRCHAHKTTLERRTS